MKVKFNNPETSLSEVGQTARNSFALGVINEQGTITCTSMFFKCRDYLQDAVWAFNGGSHFIKYGFNTKKYAWDGQTVLFWCDAPTEQAKYQFNKLNKLLNHLEIPRLTYELAEFTGSQSVNFGTSVEQGEGQIWVITLPLWYSKTLLRISLISSLLRLGYYSVYDSVVSAERYAFDAIKNPIVGCDTLWQLGLGTYIKSSESLLSCSDKLAASVLAGESGNIPSIIHDASGIYNVTEVSYDYQRNGKVNQSDFTGCILNSDAIKVCIKGINSRTRI